MSGVQLPVQLPCKMRVGSVSAGPCLPIGELHACTRAARSPTGIGNRRGGKGPRHRHERDNAQNLEAPGADHRQSAAKLSECGCLPVEQAPITVTGRHNSLPGASQSDNGVSRRLELLRFPSIARCHKVTGMNDPRSRRSRNLEMARYVRDRPATKGGWGRWHPNSQDRRIIDLLPPLRGGSENFGRPSKENLVYK